jgi:hypothetical protein
MHADILIEMTALSVIRPTAGASAESLAAWHEAQSRQYEHNSVRAGRDGARDSAAAREHQRSLQLLRDSGRSSSADQSAPPA